VAQKACQIASIVKSAPLMIGQSIILKEERKKVVKRIKIIQPFDGIFVSLRLNNF
jgi:hypothetical protein